MSLLTNAIDSIQTGVADSRSKQHARLLSSVRNIHAGILLLYKEALRRLSPVGSEEVLIKQKIVPKRDARGRVTFVGEGRKTVDVQQIRGSRDLGSRRIGSDWSGWAVSETTSSTTTPKLPRQLLQSVIADAFVLIRDFLAKQLGEDPRALLGERTWQTMLEDSEVHEREREECAGLLNDVEWCSEALGSGVVELGCEECGSPLLRPDPTTGPFAEIELECRACGAREEAESFVPRAIASSLGYEMYLSHTDGNETPYVRCPECAAEAYVTEEQRCALCEHEADHRCAMCSGLIPPEELTSSPLCGWCDHMMSKDD